MKMKRISHDNIYIKSKDHLINADRTRKALSDDDLSIPEFHEYMNLKKYNYKVKFLKMICKHYKQKVSGNKSELTSRMYTYLRLSHFIVPIQKLWRKSLLNIYNKLHGPALINRSICVNDTDFLTMEPLSSIPLPQLYTYRDASDQIYGFDIMSIYNLLMKGGTNITNPYNRQPFPHNIRNDIIKIIRLSKCFGDNVDVVFEEVDDMPLSKKLELRTVDLFHVIDCLGNYTNPSWFNCLNHFSLVKFIRELSDIWAYRAELPHHMKVAICPPLGDPFRGLNLRTMQVVYSYERLKQLALNIIEQFIRRGNSESERILGANYVLCALTLVSQDAANTMPWLYQSVAPNV